jgi:hypothetical protein
MTPNTDVQITRKCRRLFYNKTTGDVMGITSGGGVAENMTGNTLILATFAMCDSEGNDIDPLTVVGCVEEYYTPLHARKPVRVDLTKIQACCDAVDAHRSAVKAESDFVFEKGIKLFGSEQPTTDALQHLLKVQEMHTRDNPGRTSDHDDIIQTQTDLDALCKTCEDCCEQLLVTRDTAITFAERVA